MVGVKFPSCTRKGWGCTSFFFFFPFRELSVLKEKPQTERMRALCVFVCEGEREGERER